MFSVDGREVGVSVRKKISTKSFEKLGSWVIKTDMTRTRWTMLRINHPTQKLQNLTL